MGIDRRKFLKLVGWAGALQAFGASGSHKVWAATPSTDGPGPNGMLVDTTQCIGCRSCEAACAAANKLPKGGASFDDGEILKKNRDTDPQTYTVINRFEDDQGNEITVKKQCMHCNEPACASACLVRAIEKLPEGPVVYDADICLGCRYCMVACPFSMPKFEYEKAIPSIQKCTFCAPRQKAGLPPACAEACPADALLFGRRNELLEEAKTRVYQNPDDYNHHIFGEHEVGGTSFMYLAAAPFEELGFPTDLPKVEYPKLTSSFLSAVPVVLLAWPAFLAGIASFSNRKEETQHNRLGSSGRE